MKKRIIVLTSRHPTGKGIILEESDSLKTLKDRIKKDIFPELQEVTLSLSKIICKMTLKNVMSFCQFLY
jgi:hypothetical protein